MKRPRISLGAIAALLALVGILSKAHRLDPRQLWYYTASTPTVHHCLITPFATSCMKGATAPKCFYVTSPGTPGTTKLTLDTRQVYGTNCATKARYFAD
jgi:hypothetical protein